MADLDSYIGETVHTIVEADAGLVGTITVEVRSAVDGSLVFGPTSAGFAQVVTAGDAATYSLEFPAGLNVGNFVVVVDDHNADPDVRTTEARTLSVVAEVPAPEGPLKPTVQDVSLLLRTRTVKGTNAGLGADTGPASVTMFDAETRPTASEVQMLIDQAYGAIASRVPWDVPDGMPAKSQGGFRLAVAAYAARIIERSFFRETVDVNDTFFSDIMDAELAAMTEADADAGGRGHGFASLTIGTTVAPVLPPADPDVLP
jgi:hypothetical protein